MSDEKGTAEVRERPLPELGDYDVLLDMKACNICTTDYQQWLGLREHQGYPMAGGHEAAGIVKETGAKVRDLVPAIWSLQDIRDADTAQPAETESQISAMNMPVIRKMDISGDFWIF